MKEMIFIHGAFGTDSDLLPLTKLCQDVTPIHLLLPFHGKESGPRFNYEILRDALLEKLAAFPGVPVFGYSMGGYMALDLAARGLILTPEIITYGTRFFWDQPLVKSITDNMGPNALESRVPHYVEQLQQMHGDHWPHVINDTLVLMSDISFDPLTKEDFQKIKPKVKLLIGDHDRLGNVKETELVASMISNSEVQIVHSGVHQLDQMNEITLKDLAGRISSK